jgi:hypothetical protein
MPMLHFRSRWQISHVQRALALRRFDSYLPLIWVLMIASKA